MIEAKPCLHSAGCRGLRNCACVNCRTYWEHKDAEVEPTDEEIRADLIRMFSQGYNYGIQRLHTYSHQDPELIVRLLRRESPNAD